MMRTILLPLAGLAALTASACTTVVPAPQVVAVAPTGAQPMQYCREYSSTATVDGTPQQTIGTACLDASGTWRIVDPDNPPTGNPPRATASPVVAAAPPAAPPPQTYVVVPAPAPVVTYPAYPYPAYSYYPAPYYPYYYGPSVGVGFRFGGGGGRRHW